MIFPDEKRLRVACAKCMAEPSNVRAYDTLITGCRSIGRNLLRFYHIIPPTSERMIYKTYDGTGIISYHKTIAEFCNKGKSLDGMLTYRRIRDVKKVRLALLYDDSNSMTSWWRKQAMQQNLEEGDAPQTYAKLACLSLMEGLGRDMEINFWKFGSEARGPFNLSSNMYKEIIGSNGSGGTRLDLALQSMIDNGWHRRPGVKVAIVLTDGIPEVGRSVYAEDVIVNVRSLDLIKKLLQNKVHVLYLQLLTDESRKYKKSGGYTLMEFGNDVQRMGCEYMTINNKESLMESLFKGLNMVSRKI